MKKCQILWSYLHHISMYLVQILTNSRLRQFFNDSSLMFVLFHRIRVLLYKCFCLQISLIMPTLSSTSISSWACGSITPSRTSPPPPSLRQSRPYGGCRDSCGNITSDLHALCFYLGISDTATFTINRHFACL